ncbi:hypothetical protein D3C81_2072170 [compost metagenome]
MALHAAWVSGLNAEGVWLSTLTRSSTSSCRKPCGSRLKACGTITRRPPCRSAPKISHTEKSKAKEWNRVQTSLWSKRNQRSQALNSLRTLRWLSSVPLGRPVEPEV